MDISCFDISWPYDLLARLVPLDAGAAQRRQVTVREEQRDRREEAAHFQANMRDRGGARRGRLQDVLCLVPRHA